MHNVDYCCAVFFFSFRSFACRTLHATVMPSHHIFTTTKPKDLLCRIIFIIMITVVISTICKKGNMRERKKTKQTKCVSIILRICILLWVFIKILGYKGKRVSWASIQVLLMIMMTAAAMSIRKHTVEKRGIKWYAFIGNRVLSSNKKSIIMVFNQACFFVAFLYTYIPVVNSKKILYRVVVRVKMYLSLNKIITSNTQSSSSTTKVT